MRTLLLASTSVVAALLLGCAGAPPSEKMIANTKICCSSFDQLRFLQLESGETITSSLDDSSQLFEFPDGRSFALAVSVGPASASRRLLIKSYLSGAWLPTATMLYPKVQLLDANRTASRPPLSVKVSQGNDFFKGGYYATVVEIRPDDRFVVIYADPEAKGKALPHYNAPSGLTYPLAGSLVTIQAPGATHMIPAASAGRLELTLSK